MKFRIAGLCIALLTVAGLLSGQERPVDAVLTGSSMPMATQEERAAPKRLLDKKEMSNPLDPDALSEVPLAPMGLSASTIAKLKTAKSNSVPAETPKSVLIRPESAWQSLTDFGQTRKESGCEPNVSCTCSDRNCDWVPKEHLQDPGAAEQMPMLNSGPLGVRASLGEKPRIEGPIELSLGSAGEFRPTSYFETISDHEDSGINSISDQPNAHGPSVVKRASTRKPMRRKLLRGHGVEINLVADFSMGDSHLSGEWVHGPGAWNNPYFSAFGGYTVADEFEDAFTGGQGQVNVEGSLRDGWLVGAAMGQWVRPGIRGEVEFAYRSNRGDVLTAMSGGGTAATPMDGRLQSYSGMTNFLLDRQAGNLRPYFGAGFGFAFVDADLTVGATRFLIDESAMAYQGILGVAIQNGSNAEFFSEYRYFGTDDVDLVNSTSGRVTPYRATSHQLLFGVRFYR